MITLFVCGGVLTWRYDYMCNRVPWSGGVSRRSFLLSVYCTRQLCDADRPCEVRTTSAIQFSSKLSSLSDAAASSCV